MITLSYSYWFVSSSLHLWLCLETQNISTLYSKLPRQEWLLESCISCMILIVSWSILLHPPLYLDFWLYCLYYLLDPLCICNTNFPSSFEISSYRYNSLSLPGIPLHTTYLYAAFTLPLPLILLDVVQVCLLLGVLSLNPLVRGSPKPSQINSIWQVFTRSLSHFKGKKWLTVYLKYI
jgi:hypothetical protein